MLLDAADPDILTGDFCIKNLRSGQSVDISTNVGLCQTLFEHTLPFTPARHRRGKCAL
jgi:hypothetical protein